MVSATAHIHATQTSSKSLRLRYYNTFSSAEVTKNSTPPTQTKLILNRSQTEWNSKCATLAARKEHDHVKNELSQRNSMNKDSRRQTNALRNSTSRPSLLKVFKTDKARRDVRTIPQRICYVLSCGLRSRPQNLDTQDSQSSCSLDSQPNLFFIILNN
jgi:hypothetical protein